MAHLCCPGEEEAVWDRPPRPAVVLLVESCLNLNSTFWIIMIRIKLYSINLMLSLEGMMTGSVSNVCVAENC